jgi:voltage-gated potassium channel
MTLRSRTHAILETSSKEDAATRVDDFILTGLILVNVVAVVLETVPGWGARYAAVFNAIEWVSGPAFTLEYLLRLWTCVEDARYAAPLGGRLRYALRPLLLIDLLAILPFWAPMLIPLDLRILRALRLIRLLRLFKMARYVESMHTLSSVIKAKREELLITLSAIGILLLVSSTLMYYAENATQPEAFSSIPKAMWWGVTTLTTVGYGDIFPVTTLGRLMGAAIAILGVGLFALPAGILASGFSEALQARRTAACCPHCGKELA